MTAGSSRRADRVLHIVTTLDPGGAENHLRDLVAGQVSRGRSVTVAYLRGDPVSANAFERVGARVVALESRWRIDPRAIARLRSDVGTFRPDVVHAHLIEGEMLTALAGLTSPLVNTRHNDDAFWFREPMRVVGNWLARRAVRTIAISDHVRRSFVDAGVDARRIETIHYGLDSVPRESPTRAEFGLPDDRPVVGAIGRLTGQKGHDTLIDAFVRLGSLASAPWLAIVGEGEDRTTLERRAKASGAGDRIRFLGAVSDAARLMPLFDVFAHPSRWEGFGLVLLEAMAASRPIVASRVSAIPEVVHDGETGWLTSPDDPAALADALRAALGDPSEARRRGEAGHARLVETFPIGRMVDATLELYDRVVSERAVHGRRPR
ncbi:MAG: glycosyltransferase [Chloroflexota bacterium]|nr:MAG: glycosyltransferase [Chloroflexota bacterium]